MKKTLPIVLSLIIAALASGLTACGKAETNSSLPVTYVMNGYESYTDLIWTSFHGELFGEITIESDNEYVTEGNSCAKFALNNNADYGSPYNIEGTLPVNLFKYMTVEYPERFKWLDKIGKFAIDIYNASDCDIDIYFSAVGEGYKYLISDGATLYAKSWNYLVFDVKPYLLEPNTAVQDYVFYIQGLTNLSGKAATLYIDNFRADIYENQPSAPAVKAAPEFNFNGIEILNFDDITDFDYIRTLSCAESASMMPLIYSRYNKSIDVFNDKGALQVFIERSQKYDDVWEEGQGYDIVIGKPALGNVKGVKSVSIECYNPASVSHTVSLIVKKDTAVKEKSVFIAPGEKLTIETDGLSFGTLDEVRVRIESWRLTEKSQLYFANLKYKV